MLLVEGMGVKRASPPGACRRDAPGRRRAGKRKQTRGVRSALGGWPAGPWDIGHWKGAEGERADTWQACLGALSLTGGTEATTDLVVSDGANGLESALEHPRSGVAPQRCMFHTITQLADQVVCGTLPVAPSSAAAQAPRQAKRQRTKAVWVEASWVYDGASETPRRERAEVFRQAWVDRAPDAGANFWLFAIIEAKLYGAPHQAKMRFRLLCSCRRPYAIRWISLILLLNPSVIPLL